MSLLNKVSWWIECNSLGVVAHGPGGKYAASSIAELKGRVSGRAVLVLSRRLVFLKTTRLPNAKSSDLSAIVSMQAAQLFPQAKGELVYGFHLSDDINGEGRLATLFAVPVSLLNGYYEDAETAGIDVLGAVPASVGSALIATDQQLSDGAVLEETTEGLGIDVFVAGKMVYSRVAPNDSNIGVEIERTFAAAGSGVGNLVVVQGGPVEKASKTSAKSALQSIQEHVAQLDSVILQPPLAAAKREQKFVRSRARFAMLMAVAALGAIAVVWDERDRQYQAAQTERGEFNRALRFWKEERDGLSKKASALKSVDEELTRVFEPGQRMSDALTLAGNLAPKDVWLTGISLERGRLMSLRGVAMNNDAVGRFLQQLTTTERYRDVKLVFANNALIETTPVVQFSMNIHVIGNIPPFKTKQEKSKR